MKQTRRFGALDYSEIKLPVICRVPIEQFIFKLRSTWDYRLTRFVRNFSIRSRPETVRPNVGRAKRRLRAASYLKRLAPAISDIGPRPTIVIRRAPTGPRGS